MRAVPPHARGLARRCLGWAPTLSQQAWAGARGFTEFEGFYTGRFQPGTQFCLSPLWLPISSPGQGGSDSTIARGRYAGRLRYNGRRLRTPTHLFMKMSRIAPFACLLLGSFLAAGCTVYKNPNTCEAQMRAAAAHALPHDKLSITHVGVGIGGSRVVVEGTLQSRPAAAMAVQASSSAAAASAAHVSSSVAAVSVSAASAAAPSATAASAAHASSSATAASAAHVASSAASKPISRGAALECAFNGETLKTWHWLNPPELAKPDPAKSSVTQH
jgi:hypothetical protein